MDNFKKHGQPPFKITVIHGGPGAAGDVRELAQELSKDGGVLEPFQTKSTIAGQVAELKKIIEENAEVPLIIIGHSWGAVLSYIFSANHPELVKKLILISSPPFSDDYAQQITKNRQSRLTKQKQKEITAITKILNCPSTKNKDAVYARYGQLISEADGYYLLPIKFKIESNYAISQSIWPEFVKLRKSRELIKMGKKIKCPVVAIHGDYDPHPGEGVQKPLSSGIKDFQFILLKNCGHYPWREKEAKDRFFQIMKKEV